MSDSIDSFDSLANMTTSGDDPLPPDLEPLQHRMLQDSALWRASLPGTDALARQVTLLSRRKPESRQTAYRIREELRMQDPTQIDPSTRQHQETERSAHSHSRGFLAGGAALVLVALFVTLFGVLSHGGHHSGGPASTKATATTPASQHGKWQPVASLTHSPGVPVIAPSNTRVVYEIANGAVRRSSDRGDTWTNLPNPADFPTGDTPQWMDLFVSPLNPDTVWTTANLTNPGGAINCPVPYPTAFTGGGNVAQGTSALYSENINTSGSVPCQVQNVSTDGGHTWKLAKLSFAYMLGTGNPDASLNSYDQFSAPPQAQGNRLYTLTTDGPLALSGSAGHVAISTDGGVTWHDASAQLTSGGLDICNVAAVPTSSTVYAVANGNGCGLEGATAPSLWRSDDAGVQWIQVTLPSNRFIFGLVATGGAQPRLYAQTATLSHTHAFNTTTLPTDYFASSDGGKTWRHAPSAGVPANVTDSGPMTTLGDGSFVVPFLALSTSAGSNTQTPGASTPAPPLTPTPLATPTNGAVPPEAPIGTQLPIASGSSSQMTYTYTFEQWQPGNNAWQPLAHLSLYGIAQLQTLPDPTTGADALWLTVPDSGNPLGSSTFSVETYLP